MSAHQDRIGCRFEVAVMCKVMLSTLNRGETRVLRYGDLLAVQACDRVPVYVLPGLKKGKKSKRT